MKGEITLKILETIGDFAIEMGDLFYVILTSPYGSSYSRLQYELSKRRRERERRSIQKEFQSRIKIRYQKLIYTLKKDGLIEEKFKKGKKFLMLTPGGKSKLALLKNRHENKLPSVFYQRENGNNLIVVTFDIPEKEKRKRDWLRVVLKNLGFSMVHKSVWVGKIKIPRRLFEDLRLLKLVSYVEVFEVSKAGSLRELI